MDIDEIRRINIRHLERVHGPALAKNAGMSSSQFYNLRDGAKDSKTGRPRGMRKETAWRIEDAAGVPRGWLDAVHEEESNRLDSPSDDEFAMIPQLDLSASCGHGCYEDHVVVKGGLAFKRSSLATFGVPEASARIIHACGGSMEPTIQDGCVVLLNISDTEPREGRVYAIVQPDGGLVLKRLVRDYLPALGGQGWVMRSDNTDKIKFPDKILPPDDRTVIVGRAVWNDNRL